MFHSYLELFINHDQWMRLIFEMTCQGLKLKTRQVHFAYFVELDQHEIIAKTLNAKFYFNATFSSQLHKLLNITGLNLLAMFSFHQDGDGWVVYKTRMENISSGEKIRLIMDVSVYPKQER